MEYDFPVVSIPDAKPSQVIKDAWQREQWVKDPYYDAVYLEI